MLETTFELEFLQTEHLGYHPIHVEDVDHDEDDEEDGEDDGEGLAEDWHQIGLAHHFGESCTLVVDYLKEVVAQRSGDT